MSRDALRADASAEAAGDGSDDDEEARRVEYLRRHRAMLEQKRRLETERRVSELDGDKASITKRQQHIKEMGQREKQDSLSASTRGLRGSHSLPTLGSSSKIPPATRSESSIGTYAKFDELSVEMLRVIAEEQALRDMAPLNTRGKYHARYMKDAYPIAGTQLKLEKERETILAAKKKLLLSKTAGVSTRTEDKKPAGGGGSHADGQRAYRKMDFCVDKFSAVLQREQTLVDEAQNQRQTRLLGVQHREGLGHFWLLLHAQRYHETIAWLKTHRFRDVNTPVLVRQNAARPGKTAVEPNKDVGVTPLMAACRLHHVDLVRAILDQGAALYLCTANGDSAIHFLFHDWKDTEFTTLRLTTETLVRADHTLRILQLLVARDAHVNAQNAFGESALQHCARLGLLECVKLLLSHGADAFAVDRAGASALTHARAHSHDDIARLLQNYAIIERTRAKENDRKHSEALLKLKRGTLTANWSESPDKLLARLAVEDRRAGHLRNQFVDRRGHVIVCDDEEAETE